MPDLFSIAGKVALVTGGGSGIGWMIAEGYARAGAKGYIASRKKDELEARIAELGDAGEVLAVVADLSTEAGCNALGDQIEPRVIASRSCVAPGPFQSRMMRATLERVGYAITEIRIETILHPTADRAMNTQNPEAGPRPGEPTPTDKLRMESRWLKNR